MVKQTLLMWISLRRFSFLFYIAMDCVLAEFAFIKHYRVCISAYVELLSSFTIYTEASKENVRRVEEFFVWI